MKRCLTGTQGYATLPLLYLSLMLAGMAPALAASSGCLAVRGGALNFGASDNNFGSFNFEAGETVVWTFTNFVAGQIVVTPPGGILPVVGVVATFTFPTTGAFFIEKNGGQPVTATCNETTPEKQAAVTAAVKTLTEMQLVQSLAFQGQLLTELTGLFLSGAVPVVTLDRLEQKLAVFEQRKTQLNNEAANLRNLINNAPVRIANSRNNIEKLKYITKQDRLYYSPLYTLKKKCYGCGNVKVKFADLITTNILPRRDRIKRLRYDHAEIIRRRPLLPIIIFDTAGEVKRLRQELLDHTINIENTVDDYGETRRQKLALFELYLGNRGGVGLIPNAEARLAQARSDLATGPARLKATEQAIVRLNGEIAGYQALQNSRAAKVAGFESQTRAVTQQVTVAQARLAVISGELNSTNSTIGRIQNEIATLRARVGQPATPFAGANLQGALRLTSQDITPYGANPLGLRGARNGMSFFTDLNTLRNQANDEVRLQLAGGVGPEVLTRTGSANIVNPAFNVWAKGDFSDFESDQAGADRKGQAYSFATGAYFVPSPRFMIGTMYRYRQADSESVAQSSDVSTRGHGAGLYSTLVLTPTLSLSGQALYEKGKNDFLRGTTSGSFDTDQFVASAVLQGSFSFGSFWLRPAVGVIYAYVDQEGFTDSTGTPIAGQIIENGQVTFGPTIGFNIQRPGEFITMFAPSLSATGVWTFKDSGDTTLASGTIIEQDDVAVRFNGALSMTFNNGVLLSFNAGYAGFGASKVETISGGGKLTIPFGRP